MGALHLTGEVCMLADRVAIFGGGLMNAAVSGGLLLYGEAGSVSQFTWFDRAGKPLGVVGEPGEYVYVGLSPDGAAGMKQPVSGFRLGIPRAPFFGKRIQTLPSPVAIRTSASTR